MGGDPLAVDDLAGSCEWADEQGGLHKLYLRRVDGGLQTWYQRPQPREGPQFAAVPGQLPLVVPMDVWTWLAMRIWEETSEEKPPDPDVRGSA